MMKRVVLKRGQEVEIDGQCYLVEMVNSSRARLRAMDKRHVEYKTSDGKSVEFEATGGVINVAPAIWVD